MLCLPTSCDTGFDTVRLWLAFAAEVPVVSYARGALNRWLLVALKPGPTASQGQC